MRKTAAQLDIFDTTIDPDTASTTSAPVAEAPEPSDTPLEDAKRPLCLRPTASFAECRECWERHPELWPRYVTRANCVRHTR